MPVLVLCWWWVLRVAWLAFAWWCVCLWYLPLVLACCVLCWFRFLGGFVDCWFAMVLSVLTGCVSLFGMLCLLIVDGC